jgi:hypothetical protein
MPKRSIFVSHISAEAELAQTLKKHLAHDFLGSFDVFVSSDRETIRAGSKWLETLSNALQQATALIVLCSEESVRRPWVNFEAGGGWVRGIPVIPVCHSGMTPSELPVPLNMLQAVEVGDPDGLRELYEALAGTLDMLSPDANFQTISAELKTIEAKYKQAKSSVDQIENPRVLCVASRQYSEPEFGFNLDVQVLKEVFPDSLVVHRNVTSVTLRELLATERFDIIHLVLAVDRPSGDLLFSPVDQYGQPVDKKPDRMRAEAFAGLVVEAQTRLVVLATCRALLLAARVGHVANMIAADIDISGEQAAEWGKIFYGYFVRGFTLYKAFELARSDSDTPMLLIRQKDVAVVPETKRIK